MSQLQTEDSEERMFSASLSSLFRMDKLIKEAKLLVLVSHDLELVSSLCTNCIYLEKGVIKAIGESKKIVSLYKAAATS